MNKPAEKFKSDLLEELLTEITPREQEKTDKRMMLAARIDEARIRKGWSKKELADKMGRRPSEITKWLSGTHNFTTDTLFDLECFLDTKFVHTKEKDKHQVLHFHLKLTHQVKTSDCSENTNRTNPIAPYYSWAFSNQGIC